MVFYCLVGSTSCSEEGLWSEMDHHTVQVHRASRKAPDTQYYFVQQEKKMELSGCSLAWHTSVTLEKSLWKIAKSKDKPHSGPPCTWRPLALELHFNLDPASPLLKGHCSPWLNTSQAWDSSWGGWAVTVPATILCTAQLAHLAGRCGTRLVREGGHCTTSAPGPHQQCPWHSHSSMYYSNSC